MAVIEIKRRVNLDAPVTPESLAGTLYGGERNAHKFIIEAAQNGETVTLTGTVTAAFLRQADNTEIALTGAIENGRATVTLAQSCYARPGRFELTVFVTAGGAKMAIYSVNGNVRNTAAGTIIDPGEIVPDITDILAAYADVIEATENANAAADAMTQFTDATTKIYGGRLRNNFQTGGYSQTGVTSSTTRAYCIFTNVPIGTHILFDATQYFVNYYYIVSPSDFTLIYSPDEWNDSGDITLQHAEHATVFVMCRDATNSSRVLTDDLANINKTINVCAPDKSRAYINWVAFGDSITNGSASTASGTTINNARYGYAYKIAKDVRVNDVNEFYNCGVRGLGWAKAGNNNETVDDMMALFTGDKDSINLVTIMLGVNDYAGLQMIGTHESVEHDGTINGNIRYVLKKIANDYQNAKIVAISPINYTGHGNADNGWSRNVRLTNPGTLQGIADDIKYWCDVYSIQFIDELASGVINNRNALNFIKDRFHPTLEGHMMLAREIARKIDF